jgi:hypothetical protein
MRQTAALTLVSASSQGSSVIVCFNISEFSRPAHNADIYFAGPRAAEAHIGAAGCHVRFLNFPRRRGYLRDRRRILRLDFTMPSSIARSARQKPRRSSSKSMADSIKTGSFLH